MIDTEYFNALIKRYFPDGCQVCNGHVKYLTESFTYICDDCGAYISAHRKETPYTTKYSPEGYMAGKETNLLRRHLYETLSPLYLDKMETTRKNTPITTAPINILFDYFCVEVTYDEIPHYAYVISKSEDRMYRVILFENGELKMVDREFVNNVPNRVKVYIWLSQQMNIPTDQCNIKTMSIEQMEEAIIICNAARRQLQENIIKQG